MHRWGGCSNDGAAVARSYDMILTSLPIRGRMISRAFLGSAALALLSGQALAQQDVFARLDELAAKLEQKRQDYHIPGMAIVVLRGNPSEKSPPELAAL